MKTKRLLVFVFIVLGASFLTGCIAPAGKMGSNAQKLKGEDIGILFKVDKFAFVDDGVAEQYDQHMNGMQPSMLLEYGNEEYPAMFVREISQKGVPLSVKITQMPRKKSDFWIWGSYAYTNLFLSLVTLGIIPTYMPTMTTEYKMEVDVQLQSGQKVFSFTEPLIIYESAWMFSLIPWYKNSYQSNIRYEKGGKRWMEYNEVDVNAPVKKKMEFFKEAIVHALANGIYRNKDEISQKISSEDVGSRWGIVIGYETDNSLYAVDDMRQMRAWLIRRKWNPEKMKAFSGRNVTKSKLEETLNGFLSKAESNDMMVFAWSGEIYADSGSQDDVYLTCRAETGKDKAGYRLKDVFSALKASAATKAVLIFDVSNGNGKTLLTSDYLKSLSPLEDWLVISHEIAKRESEENQGWLFSQIIDCVDKGSADKEQKVSWRRIVEWLNDKGREQHRQLQFVMPNGQSRTLELPLGNE